MQVDWFVDSSILCLILRTTVTSLSSFKNTRYKTHRILYTSILVFLFEHVRRHTSCVRDDKRLPLVFVLTLGSILRRDKIQLALGMILAHPHRLLKTVKIKFVYNSTVCHWQQFLLSLPLNAAPPWHLKYTTLDWNFDTVRMSVYLSLCIYII